MVGINMFAEIQKRKQMGYKKQQAARELGLDNKTVRKYWDMNEREYAQYLLDSRERSRCMEPYRDMIVDKLKAHREIASAVIYDQLREADACFACSYRSVRRYVREIRLQEGLLTPLQIRQYTEVAETPLGFQGQVDMGVKTMTDPYGTNVKIYIFAMVLSNSRYKFMCFQREPFTAQTFCRAHDAAFRYFGGRPSEIVYDQDRVMVVSENGGDIIYTEAFENYKNYAGFSVHLCRGYDPESKGKIENVIKYIKGNFLPYRTFYSTHQLNSEGLQWLERTGNGLIHNTTKIVPAVAFAQERKHLKPAPQLGETPALPRLALIRKDNVVMYKQNRYSMPKGTYRPNKQARIEEDGKIVSFFDTETNELIEQLPLADGIGKSVRNTHPERQRNTKHETLLKRVLDGFGNDESAKNFVDGILSRKPRYTRDQLSMLIKLQEKYDRKDLIAAITYCQNRALYSASDFGDSLAYLAKAIEPKKCTSNRLPIKYSVIRAEARPLATYAQLENIGDAP